MFLKLVLYFILVILIVKIVKVIYKFNLFWFDYILKNEKKIYLFEVMIVIIKIYNVDDCCVILFEDFV